MQRAVEAAPQIGLAGAQPYCPRAADGDDSQLMAASGETELTTHASAVYRLALAGAYTQCVPAGERDQRAGHPHAGRPNRA